MAASASFATNPSVPRPVDLLVIAGEHSGDEHGARMVRRLLQLRPTMRICAIGGPKLAEAGAELLHDLTATSVVGFVEVLKHYRYFRDVFRATLGWIGQNQPRAVCFVDYPGFNLRLAKRLRELGLSVKGGGKIRMLYYISPQIWAWKAKRRFTMARDLDALATIFPFEVECYKDTDLPVEFVGHPFLAVGYQPPVRYAPTGPILLLPGSRVQAVERILPDFLNAFAEFSRTRAEAKGMIVYPSQEIADVARLVLRGFPALATKVTLQPNNVPWAAKAVLTSSGTMSLHCALNGLPGAIGYRTNPLTYFLAKRWVKIDYIGIANLLLKEAMYPEFIQGAATAQALANQLAECSDEPERLEKTRQQATKLRKILAQPAQGDVADWVLKKMV